MTLSSTELAIRLRSIAERSGWEALAIDEYSADPSTGQPELVEVEPFQGRGCPFRVQVEEGDFVIEFGVGSRLELQDSLELWDVINALLEGRVEELVWRRRSAVARADAKVHLRSGRTKRSVTRHDLFPLLRRGPSEVHRYEPYR